MCRKQIFSESPETPRNTLEKIIKNPCQRWRLGGPHPVHEGGGRLPPSWARPLPRGPPRNPPTPTPTLYIRFRREKNQREQIIAFYDTEPPPSPKTSREGWSGVRSGLRRGESVAIVIINHPPSPISWCSPPCMSNSIVGLLDGDGLDECNRVSFVRVWSLVSTMFWDWCCYDFAMLNACH